MVSFKDYLETCRFSGSPEAEFVEEARSNSDLHDVDTWEELRSTLLNRPGATPRTIDAAEAVWRDYAKTQV